MGFSYFEELIKDKKKLLVMDYNPELLLHCTEKEYLAFTETSLAQK